MKDFIKYISLMFCVVLIFSGCAKREHKKVFLLLDWWPNPIHAPIYAGVEMGIFAEEGIDLEVIKTNDAPETIPMLLSKRADVALYYMPNTIMASQKTKQLRVVANYIDRPLNAFLFREDSGIKDIHDMHNKILGGFPDGLIQTYIASLSRTTGIEFSQFRKIHSDLISALYNKSVDMITGVFWNIESQQLKALGVPTKHFPLQDFGFPNYHELVFISREDYLVQHPDFRKKFQRAIEKSILYAKNNPSDAFALYTSVNPDKDDFTQGWEVLAWQETVPLFAVDQQPNLDVWNNFSHWMFNHGLIDFPIDLSHLYKN